MRHLLCALLATARSSLRPQRELAIENLALRQQLAILKRTTKRPRLTNADRAFWVALSRLWSDWQHALLLVKPETVIGWHRKGFRLYWTWKSRSRSGRPRIDAEIRTLVDRMARENPTWGAPRIHGEFGTTSSTITDPGPTSRSTRTPPNPAGESPPMRGRSSPSRWSAACIIATHDAQLEPKPRSHNEPRA